jgi:hypothetical protein
MIDLQAVLEWLYTPSLVPNGTILAILIACAAMTALAGWLSIVSYKAENGGKFLMDEAFKAAARESILLGALYERAPEEYEDTLTRVRHEELRPDLELVRIIQAVTAAQRSGRHA